MKRIVLTLSALVNAEKKDPDEMPRCHADGNASVPEAVCGAAHPDEEYIEVPELKSLN